MKTYLLALFVCLLHPPATAQTVGPGSRMNEIFQRTDLASGPTRLYDPWEVTYGPDGYLWITEAKTYKVYRMDPVTGTKTQVLDLSNGSSFTPSSFKRNFAGNQNPWPQGGMAGLAIHPDFMNSSSPKKYIYVSYVKSYDSTSVTTNGGVFFTNSIVRFTYNTVTGLLENPVAICDTLPGSSDHNSQRMIIAPVNGIPFLFYAQGDMGAGQFGNARRTEYAQDLNKYEGKILRFNLEPDGDGGAYDKWIPNDNPFNGASQSAIWCLGIRNNQGFAAARIAGTDYLYGSSHGPFSDDELNIIKSSGNYGHPLVIGYAADGNYDAAGAGNTVTAGTGTLPFIVSEAANAASLANYQDPIYSFYPAAQGNTGSPATSGVSTVQRMYYDFNHGNQSNANWPSEAPSGMDIYTKSKIPGWKNSLLLSALKGGKLIRLKLNTMGNGIDPNPNDTINYFRSTNRFRDLAISPDGLSLYTVIDSSATTSGPTSGNPIISVCRGCVQKYSFLGYAPLAGTSTISNNILIAAGKANICEDVNTININTNNSNYWVPITDTNSNIVAEINPNGNILGDVSTAVFTNTNTIRETGNGTLYLDRNITITPQYQPATPVSIRLYLNNTEFNNLKNGMNSLGQPSGVNAITDIAIFKNTDVCSNAIAGVPQMMPTTHQSAFGTGGYVVQADINSFSTFYLASVTAVLPIRLVSFTGVLENHQAKLNWVTENESDTRLFSIERSVNGNAFDSIGQVTARNAGTSMNYQFWDPGISDLLSDHFFYRLKIIDKDGKYSYSPVVVLNVNSAGAVLTLHPNPVTDKLYININSKVVTQAVLIITDNSGRVVISKTINLSTGVNNFTIPLNGLAAGMYYINIKGGSINLNSKIQKN